MKAVRFIIWAMLASFLMYMVLIVPAMLTDFHNNFGFDWNILCIGAFILFVLAGVFALIFSIKNGGDLF